MVLIVFERHITKNCISEVSRREKQLKKNSDLTKIRSVASTQKQPKRQVTRVLFE